jgi:DNA ligase-associated metallophosphoesterase
MADDGRPIIDGQVAHTVRGQRLHLLPERALYWPQKQMLVVADPHFGKAQVFRERGIPVPRGTTAADLERLSELIDRLRPITLLILGDLTHGPIDDAASYTRLIGPWRRRHAKVELLLISGNHDRLSGGPPAPFGFDWVGSEKAAGPFVFTHQPQDPAAGYGLAGHLHPAVALTGRGGLQAKLPCFRFGLQNAVLPAFGGFTGSRLIRPRPADRVFVIADSAVIALPARERPNY